jgi:hypothetical protein
LQDDIQYARTSSVRARVAIGVPSFIHGDADGPLKAFGVGQNEVLEGTLPIQWYNADTSKNETLQITITPTAKITLAGRVDGKLNRGTTPETIQGKCTGHSITGEVAKLFPLTIQLSH